MALGTRKCEGPCGLEKPWTLFPHGGSAWPGWCKACIKSIRKASTKGYWGETDYRRAYHARRRSLLKDGPFDVINRRAVWGRDEGHCRIKLVCDGVFVPFDEMHLDHVIPVSKGGTHTWSNVQTGCASCNQVKSNSILERR